MRSLPKWCIKWSPFECAKFVDLINQNNNTVALGFSSHFRKQTCLFLKKEKGRAFLPGVFRTVNEKSPITDFNLHCTRIPYQYNSALPLEIQVQLFRGFSSFQISRSNSSDGSRMNWTIWVYQFAECQIESISTDLKWRIRSCHEFDSWVIQVFIYHMPDKLSDVLRIDDFIPHLPTLRTLLNNGSQAWVWKTASDDMGVIGRTWFKEVVSFRTAPKT